MHQARQGGLGINLGLAPIGLLVYGNGEDKGRVGIGTLTPLAKLHLLGNLLISGVFLTDNNEGASNQVLAIAPSGTTLEWKDKYSWLALTSSNSSGSGNNNSSCEFSPGPPVTGENCWNSPVDCACLNGLVCTPQGICVSAHGSPPPPPPPPPNWGNGALATGEQCDSSIGISIGGICPPVDVVCSGGGTHQEFAATCISCQCIPPFDPPICGGGGESGCGYLGNAQCGGPCPNSNEVCKYTAADSTGGTCDCKPSPPVDCGSSAPACNGTCPPEQQCASIGSNCTCTSAPSSNSNHELLKIPGLEKAYAQENNVCQTAGLAQPPPCPSGGPSGTWTEHGLFCVGIGANPSVAAMWVRTCWKPQ